MFYSKEDHLLAPGTSGIVKEELEDHFAFAVMPCLKYCLQEILSPECGRIVFGSFSDNFRIAFEPFSDHFKLFSSLVLCLRLFVDRFHAVFGSGNKLCSASVTIDVSEVASWTWHGDQVERENQLHLS